MLGGASGAISGLVAITPACAVVGPMGAIILGFVASIVAYWACTSLKKAIGYDDSLDVFGIHGVAGISRRTRISHFNVTNIWWSRL